jgi:hypothetical protein
MQAEGESRHFQYTQLLTRERNAQDPRENGVELRETIARSQVYALPRLDLNCVRAAVDAGLIEVLGAINLRLRNR